jgi:hypothetical protein
MADKEIPKWRDRFEVLAPEDHDSLEVNAAQHEFRGGMSKDDAENRAHKDYLRNHALDSAAHHYLGMRAAIAGNHQTAAKKHGEAYSLVMNHLGFSSIDAPPKELLDRVQDAEKSPYKFSPHKADTFFAPKIPETPQPTEKEKTLQLIEKLKALGSKPDTDKENS